MAIGIVLVGKGGEVTETRVTDAEPLTLARKCGFKRATGFAKRASWPAAGEPSLVIEMWARGEGRAGSENKYDFPPPVDSSLFFGACCLVARRQHSATIECLRAETWARTYEKLFGGFEDITQEEEPSSDELEDVEPEMKTESGYLRDGFVTDGDDADDSDEDEGETEASAVSVSGDSDEDDDEVPLESDSDGGGELEASDYEYSEGDDDDDDDGGASGEDVPPEIEST